MLTIVLGDSELERVPGQIADHPQVAAAARKAGRPAVRTLLDGSLHHAAMRRLDDAARRGRPDLVHLFLLTALESRANRAGNLAVRIHTRHDEWIDVDRETRIIRNYNRFCGLIEQLFEQKEVPKDRKLLQLREGVGLIAAVESLRPDRVVWLDEAAPTVRPRQVFRPEDRAGHVVAVIGGFPHGTFRTPRPPGAEHVGFGPDALSVWTVAAELTVHYQDLCEAEA